MPDRDKQPLRVAVVGSRTAGTEACYRQLCQQLYSIGPGVIVSGGASGADQLAARYAREHGLPLVEHLPDWNTHGKKAGILRNRLIVEGADMVVALWDGQSRGTKNTIETARNLGRPVIVVMVGGVYPCE